MIVYPHNLGVGDILCFEHESSYAILLKIEQEGVLRTKLKFLGLEKIYYSAVDEVLPIVGIKNIIKNEKHWNL